MLVEMDDTATAYDSHPTPPASPLRVHRVAASLRQVDLARQAGISRSAVAELERGTYFPSIPVQRALAYALGVDVDALWPPLTENDNGAPPQDAAVKDGQAGPTRGT
jgi:DNA-binding XRE family transcriptional regulator